MYIKRLPKGGLFINIYSLNLNYSFMHEYTLSALVTLSTSLMIFFLAFRVGMTRMKHKVKPYEDTKEKAVLIANRVHMNTIEMTVVYLPILWVATVFSSANLAWILGIAWFITRVGYAVAYTQKPKKRELPFIMGVACIGLTSLLALYGIIF